MHNKLSKGASVNSDRSKTTEATRSTDETLTVSRNDSQAASNEVFDFITLPCQTIDSIKSYELEIEQFYKTKYTKTKQKLQEARDMLVKSKNQLKKKEGKLEELQVQYSSEKKQVQKLKNTFLNPRDLERDDTTELTKLASKLYVGIEESKKLDENASLTIWGNKP